MEATPIGPLYARFCDVSPVKCFRVKQAEEKLSVIKIYVYVTHINIYYISNRLDQSANKKAA